MSNNGHYYSVTVDSRGNDQGYDTGYQSGHDTEDWARTELREQIAFVMSIGKIVTRAKVTKVCGTCFGCGTVFVPQKRNPRLGKNKRCPACKGRDSEVTVSTWVDIPNEYRQILADVKGE